MNYEDVKIKINTTVLPAPISMDYSLEDLDADSERDVKRGILDRNRIRSDVFKLSLAYSIDDVDKVSKILKAIAPETFNVELFDIKNNKRVTKKMYAGPKSMQMICNNGIWIKGLKFNLTEV